jgi:hypothetical protein
MDEHQERPETGGPRARTSGRTRLIWILLAGALVPAPIAKYLVPSLLVPMLVLSGIMIAAGVALILTHSPTDQ